MGNKNKVIGSITRPSPRHVKVTGDAIKIFFQNFYNYQNTEELTFYCVHIENLVIKENRLKLEKMRKLRTLNLIHNNIHEYLELINLENISDLKYLNIKHNPVIDC